MTLWTIRGAATVRVDPCLVPCKAAWRSFFQSILALDPVVQANAGKNDFRSLNSTGSRNHAKDFLC